MEGVTSHTGRADSLGVSTTPVSCRWSIMMNHIFDIDSHTINALSRAWSNRDSLWIHGMTVTVDMSHHQHHFKLCARLFLETLPWPGNQGEQEAAAETLKYTAAKLDP